MSKFTYLINKISDKPNTHENMEKITQILDYTIGVVESKFPELYNTTIDKLCELAYHIDRPDAEKIVIAMKPFGEKWSFEKVQNYLLEKGITEHICRWYLVMNMSYNDYHNTAKYVDKAEDPEFYFNVSRDFIMDIDASPYKVEKYFIK